MSNLIILEYCSITNMYGVFGTKSIQYVLFFISVFKTNIFSKIINNKDLINSLSLKKPENLSNLLEKTRQQIYNTYGIFDFIIDNNHQMLAKLMEFTNNLNENSIDIANIIDDSFITHLNTENLSVVKDYVKFYNNKQLISWIVSNTNINIEQSDRILDANCKINSFYEEIRNSALTKKQKKSLNSKLFGIQPNSIYKTFLLLENLIKYGETFTTNIGAFDPLVTDININGLGMYDLIFLDMPHGIHNVIHASCCQKIKKLKLRGTKAEPLLLQLVMSSLNKNGKGILIVPDSLLFSDSLQPVETREYLLNNFNVKKIIQIDESLYWGNKISRDLKSQSSTIKNSILIFENNGKTKLVEFSKIALKDNEIIETKCTEIKYELFESNVYSLYYKNYLDMLERKSDKIDFMNFTELFNIDTNLDQKLNEKTIALEKNYKDLSSIQCIDKTQLETSNKLIDLKNYSMFIKEKPNSNVILNYPICYLEFKLKSDPEKYVKGKMAQFDIKKIQEIKIPIISKNKQSAVCSYISVTNTIINENNNKISLCVDTIKCIIETIPLDKMVKIEQIVNIYQSGELDSVDIPNSIGIIKNGLGAGTVYLPSMQTQPLNNSHYIVVKNSNEFIKNYLYEYLKYSEEKLKNLANLTPQPNLTKTSLSEFLIPDIDIVNQEHLCSHCEVFNKTIERLVSSNNEIKQKPIISTIIKINGF
jgi:hypothetical protein